jgi:hypothetical protein
MNIKHIALIVTFTLTLQTFSMFQFPKKDVEMLQKEIGANNPAFVKCSTMEYSTENTDPDATIAFAMCGNLICHLGLKNERLAKKNNPKISDQEKLQYQRSYLDEILDDNKRSLSLMHAITELTDNDTEAMDKIIDALNQ